MTNRIEVGFKKGIRDALGEKTKKRIADNLGLPVASVATVEVYTVAGELSAAELRQSAEGPLSDPVIQEYAINKPLAKNFDWLIEVGFRPGVTDNVGKTAREAITLLLGTSLGERKINVYTSRQYLISGPITKADAENIASGLLANDLIERHQVVGRAEFDFVNGMPAHIPQVTGRDEPQVAKINLTRLDAAALLKISQESSSRSTSKRCRQSPHTLPIPRSSKPAGNSAWTKTRPTWSWNASRKPCRSTANTRSSRPTSRSTITSAASCGPSDRSSRPASSARRAMSSRSSTLGAKASW